MMVCFLPINRKQNIKLEKIKYRYIKPIAVICNISKDTIFELMYKILQNITELNVCGFNTATNVFWCKKIIRTESVVYFNISINKKEYSTSVITIIPIVGNDNEINKILTKIINLLKLYDK